MRFKLHDKADTKKVSVKYRVCFDSKRFEDAYLSEYVDLDEAIAFRDSFNKQERLVMEHGGVHIEKWTLTKEIINIEE